MRHLQQRFAVSERRACQVVGQPRSTQRYEPERPLRDRAIVDEMKKISRAKPRYGYRRIWSCLRRKGWRVNRKRVQRLWREHGFKVVRRQRKRRRLGSSENGAQRMRAEYKNHVWSYDFTMDQTADGRRLKFFAIVDEHTRECHALKVERSITAADVVPMLDYLFRVHGEPEFIRSDNGPEFIANAVRAWLAASGVGTLYIEPGSPWENPYIESFNSRLEDEFLGRELFTSLAEAKILAEQFRLEYNHERPHSSLDYKTPAEFAASCEVASVASAPIGAPAFDLPRDKVDEVKINSGLP